MRQGARRMTVRMMVVVAAVVGLALLGAAAPAAAHLGDPFDPRIVHACVASRDGAVRIVGPTGSCNANKETALHWAGLGFVDLGLTVLDRQTGLEWEKKTTAVGSGQNFADLNDVDNTYTWCVATGDSTAGTQCAGNVESWIADLNAAGFAGHSDWRVPSVAELLSIVDPSVVGCGSGTPCIDAIFGPTAASFYWSSTEAASPDRANGVLFFSGSGGNVTKDASVYVRAVRGGL